jgi:uncharacterized repeat protein (TIGR01451 family)
LWVRFAGSPNLRVTYFQGKPDGTEYPGHAQVGLRPGYIQRVKITGFNEHPDLALYPTLEVRGTLCLPVNAPASRFPVPVTISDSDAERALQGALITKVIVLEDPERAIPQATSADAPLEFELTRERDIIQDARARGRIMLIVRFGEVQPDPQELASRSIPGTIQLPDQKVLAPAQAPPCLPFVSHQLVDPVLGPKPLTEECFHDGGDGRRPVGLVPGGGLYGLDPSDTVAEYFDSHGRRKLAISNKVCVCVPRFLSFRIETWPLGYQTAAVIAQAVALQNRGQFDSAVPSRHTDQLQAPKMQQASMKASIAQAQQGTAVFGKIAGTQVMDIVNIVGEFTGSPVKCPPPDRPLILTKCADRNTGQIGELINFTLRYSNVGGQPITNVIVSDSLTPRLEFVPNSAKTDRAAVFTTQQNEAGSVILRWEVDGQLLPGQTGTVTFQARIR